MRTTLLAPRHNALFIGVPEVKLLKVKVLDVVNVVTPPNAPVLAMPALLLVIPPVVVVIPATERVPLLPIVTLLLNV